MVGKRHWHTLAPLFLLAVTSLMHLSSIQNQSSSFEQQRDNGLPTLNPLRQQRERRAQKIQRRKELQEKLSRPPKVNLTFSGKRRRKIAFLHVGKAGGNTIRAALPRLYCQRHKDRQDHDKCWHDTARPDAPLRDGAELEVHMGQVPKNGAQRIRMGNFTTFLFALREPLSRMRSAYHFLHPNNKDSSAFAKMTHAHKTSFYEDCFPTWQNLMEAVDGAYASVTAISSSPQQSQQSQQSHNASHVLTFCQRLAILGLRGELGMVKKINVHFYFNHLFYANMSTHVFPSTEVFVVRTESLWDDLIDLDRSLGGPGTFRHQGAVMNENKDHAASDASPTAASSTETPPPTFISGSSQQTDRNLCCILWEELALYQEILHSAVNLLPEDKATTMDQLQRICGVKEERWHSNSNNNQIDWTAWQDQACPNVNPFLFQGRLRMDSLERQQRKQQQVASSAENSDPLQAERAAQAQEFKKKRKKKQQQQQQQQKGSSDQPLQVTLKTTKGGTLKLQ